ncbi:AraC family transcriptional regulator [Kaistia sp. 32K]|uniref:GlxA family transcriptional regulator n=1 Tax=Kaistia sp. 32K TaxID=2795690 RepID=UPI001916A75A|nr:GlxA family transcriptional regulator [Kaistia sp. 32K]BCP53070.1 AraC family transcriptional regulator [Kaistia sp. 32K]
MATERTTEIGMVLYPDVQMAAVLGLTDLFAMANRMARGRDGAKSGTIRVSHWRQNGPEGAIGRVFDTLPERVAGEPAALIAVPSLAGPVEPADAAPYAAWLSRFHAAGGTLVAACAGVFLLGETGLLAGRTVTTHWVLGERFHRRFPDARLDIDRLLVDEGDLVTAGGMMAWTDLGLRLVDRYLGSEVMLDTARMLLVDPPGREQRYYSTFVPRLDHGDRAVLQAQHWLHGQGAKDASLESLAAHAGLEERTFLRRFRKATGRTATEYQQELKVNKARELLQFSALSVDQIAFDVGYGDAGAFRKVFARIVGLSPAEYRRRFHA